MGIIFLGYCIPFYLKAKIIKNVEELCTQKINNTKSQLMF